MSERLTAIDLWAASHAQSHLPIRLTTADYRGGATMQSRASSGQYRRIDEISLVEAAYRIDRTDSEWLHGIAAAAAPLLDAGLGVSALTAETTDGRVFIRDAACVGGAMELHDAVASYAGDAEPSVLLDAFRFARCSTMSAAAGGPERLSEDPASVAFDRIGIRDALGVLGIDGTRHTVAISVYLGKSSAPSPRFVMRWSRVAGHLAAGFRVRRGLSTTRAIAGRSDGFAGAEAIYSAEGRAQHLESPAREASATLTRAIVAMRHARGQLRELSPDAALDAWRGLVDGRWSLVDYIDTDGKRFLLARKNDPEASVPDVAGLTRRERAVLAARARALSLKVIAYDLGLSIAAISKSLASGMAKLGLANDAELVAFVSSEVS